MKASGWIHVPFYLQHKAHPLTTKPKATSGSPSLRWYRNDPPYVFLFRGQPTECSTLPGLHFFSSIVQTLKTQKKRGEVQMFSSAMKRLLCYSRYSRYKTNVIVESELLHLLWLKSNHKCTSDCKHVSSGWTLLTWSHQSYRSHI